MDTVWENSERFAAINTALENLPHDQTGMGLGFKLAHNPTRCRRCRANIAVLELGAIINFLENPPKEIDEGVEILDA